MGMYTELHLNAEMRQDTPEQVLEVLRYMLGEMDTEPSLPSHEFFQTSRWRVLFKADSYYFSADTHCTLRWDKIARTHYLCIRSNLKNYDSEIEKFVAWITPYLANDAGEFLGFHRYEEDQQPTLIFMPTEDAT
jgi:hypothetical protein